MNKNFKALEDLQEATKKAEISANEFRIQYEKAFPKRTLKEAKFKKKAEEQNVEIKHPNVGDEIQLGSSMVEFLGPVDENGKEIPNFIFKRLFHPFL